MHRFISVSTVLCSVLLALGAAACGSDNPTTAPTTDVPTITESFSDTVTVNGARTHPFTVSKAGTVTATLIVLSPDSTVTIGLSLGTWNGTSCQIIIANDAAVLNSAATGTAQTGGGSYCVRVYDVGRLTAPTDYTVQVTHT